jgi:hypothetical protein
MATFIHVDDINPRVGTAGLWINPDAIDFLEATNRGQDTEMTLRSGRVIRVVGSLDSWKTNFTRHDP